MWYLLWTKGLSLQDADADHSKVPLGIEAISKQKDANEAALVIWQELLKEEKSKLLRYRNPKLVWMEKLQLHKKS